MKTRNNKELTRREIVEEIGCGILEAIQEIINKGTQPEEVCVSDIVYFFDGLICEKFGNVTRKERYDFEYKTRKLLNAQD